MLNILSCKKHLAPYIFVQNINLVSYHFYIKQKVLRIYHQ